MIALSSVLGPRGPRLVGCRLGLSDSWRLSLAARHVYVRSAAYGTTVRTTSDQLAFFTSSRRFADLVRSKINVQKNRVHVHAGSWKLLTLYG